MLAQSHTGGRSLIEGKPKYNRILLKLTGQILESGSKIWSRDAAIAIVTEIREAYDLGVEIAIVIGGGNIGRGRRDFKDDYFLKQATADLMCMLATVQNGLYLADALENAFEKHCMITRVMSSLEIKQAVESFIRKRATRHLGKGRVIVLVGGIGSPNFTTDATAVNHAVTIEADAILKGTKVDYIYDRDPLLDPKGAVFFKTISKDEVIRRKLEIVEETALSLNSSKIPFHVFNIFTPGNLKGLLLGKDVGSEIIF